MTGHEDLIASLSLPDLDDRHVLTASLLKEPVSGKLQAVIREYIEFRLALAEAPTPDAATLQRHLDKIQEMHARTLSLVGEAVDGGTPVVVSLVNTFNEVTSSDAARLAAVRDRLPTSIVLLLLLGAVVSMVLLGMQQGASGEWRIAGTLSFVALVCMVVWVTLDT
jgi:hypothetical protein